MKQAEKAPGTSTCQACFMRAASISRFGHCRRSDKCARLRTTEERSNRNGLTPVKDLLCAQVDKARKLHQMQSGDTNSPRGRNASRAWLIACAPIRILLRCSRRSQSSLLPRFASHSPFVNEPSLTEGNPLTLSHSIVTLYPPPVCLALPRQTNVYVPLP
jgi:hypothetical protein